MKIRPGLGEYKGPEAAHKERRSKILADAKFVMKYLKYSNLNGFDIFIFVRDKSDGRLDIVVRKGEEPFWSSKG